jgi:hypothetical protein
LSKVELRPAAKRLAALFPDVQMGWQLPTVVEALLELPIAHAVEELVVGQFETAPYMTIYVLGTFAPVTLRRLHLAVEGMRRAPEGSNFFVLRFPGLEELRCDLELDASGVSKIASADMPKLHTLSIRMLGDADPVRVGGDDVANSMTELKRLLVRRELRHIEIATPTPTILARSVIDLAPTHLSELVIRSKRAIDNDVVLPPYVRFDQQPLYRMGR